MRRAQLDMAALVAMAGNTRFLGDGGCFRVTDRADTVYFDPLRAAPSQRAGKPKQISRHHLQRMEVLRDLIHDHAVNDLYPFTAGTSALLEDGELCCLITPKDGQRTIGSDWATWVWRSCLRCIPTHNCEHCCWLDLSARRGKRASGVQAKS